MNPKVRQTVLVVILLIVGGAFAYDRFVAKGKQVRMMEDLAALSDTGDSHTEEKIKKLFASDGEVVTKGDTVKWVKYSVRRPTLFQTYDVYVKYKQSKDGFVMIDKRDVPPDSDEDLGAQTETGGVVNFEGDPNAKKGPKQPNF